MVVVVNQGVASWNPVKYAVQHIALRVGDISMSVKYLDCLVNAARRLRKSPRCELCSV